MTLSDLLTDLQSLPADAPLVFATNQGPIGAGYHITELKSLDIQSIDCGGTKSAWPETQLQLLDGHSGPYMTSAKAQTILAKSLKAIPALGTGELSIEFAPQNQGLRRYIPASPELEDGRVVLRLLEDGATCKAASYAPQTTSCCGASARCC